MGPIWVEVTNIFCDIFLKKHIKKLHDLNFLTKKCTWSNIIFDYKYSKTESDFFCILDIIIYLLKLKIPYKVSRFLKKIIRCGTVCFNNFFVVTKYLDRFFYV